MIGEALLYVIAKKLDLSYNDYTQLVQDVSNFKGRKWVATVSELHNKSLVNDYKKLIKQDFKSIENQNLL